MDNDATKIVPPVGGGNGMNGGAPAPAAGNGSQSVGAPSQPVKKPVKGKGGGGTAAGVGVVAGAAIGGGVGVGYATTHPFDTVNEDGENENPDEIKAEVEAPTEEDAILATEDGIRYAHIDADSFQEAYMAARAQVGAGGMFEYNGKLYSTYTKEEWNALSPEERNDYQNLVRETAPDNFTAAHHHSSSHSHAAATQTVAHHETPSYPEAHSQDVAMHTPQTQSDRLDVVDEGPADGEVHVLGVDRMTNEDGETIGVALVEREGDVALMVDVDDDGRIDVIVHDDNYNGEIEANEVHPMPEGSNVGMDDLVALHEQQFGADEASQQYYADNDTPDYFSEADGMPC